MQTAVIIDIVLALILLGFAAAGWRRGALKSVIGIVIVLAALIGAGIVAEQGAPMAAKALSPVISEQVETRLGVAAEDAWGVGGDGGFADVYSAAGLYEKTAEQLAAGAAARMRETGETLLTAAVEQLVLYVSRAVLFLLAFFVLLAALKVVSRLLGLLTAVPGLHLANALGGGVLGFLQGCLVLLAVVWAMQFFGSGVSEELMEQTRLLRLFAGVDPLQVWAGL